MMWHFYLDVDNDPVPIGTRALCGHVAEVETDRHIRPGDERCPECARLLDHVEAETA